ncbi:WD40 repeat domain-containing protein [Microcoleus sp. FACHB-1515]|uniref:WD40 repeat domain-containing protein n=1 Tax=Cyanophyceae TaxID=3028117 RepID=UPI00168920A7|nr:WD40 repeat domain-containing protein [Microcoleus sp. FACHB-1515]MBD2088358.1 WD40 repeat domain-containing protein [Microcoleus sp. FACHB-1515]
MSVEEALAIAAQLLPQQRLNKVEELVFRQTWEGQSYQEIAKASGYGLGYIKDTGSKLWRSLSEALNVKVTKFNFRVILQQQAQQQAQQAIEPARMHQDWGDAIDVSGFYDRSSELETLSSWIRNRCRLIGIVGMGGIGKTALSVKLAEQVQTEFDGLIWRSLRDAPPLSELLTTLIRGLAEPDLQLPDSDGGKLTQLLECLRQKRCLIVLDNFDALFQAGQRVGVYREGDAGYGELLRRVGETRHPSCLVLTSREQPIEVSILQGEHAAVKVLPLTGLSAIAAEQLLVDKNLQGSSAQVQMLTTRYQGNPLALKITAAIIHDIFAGQIEPFLQTEMIVFDGIRQLIREQIDRLSDLEIKLMYWLAINREPISAIELQDDLVPPVSPIKVVEALESLKARSLIERSPSGFTQQPVVMEYLIERLIEQVCAELLHFQPHHSFLNAFALIKATARDYIRDSQVRVILQPLVEQAIAQLGSDRDLADQLSHLLWQYRQAEYKAGYAIGNVINLLCHLDIDLTGSDFSHFPVWQAYVADVSLQQVNFAYADLSKSVFAETFGGVCCVAFSPNGELLATSDTSGEVQIWHLGSGKQQIAFKADTVWTWAIAFSPDGTRLATGGDDRQVKLWDVATGECIQILSGHTHTINAIAFSPNGQLLASCAEEIRLWSLPAFTCEAVLSEHSARVWSIAFSTDSQILVSGSEDCTVKVWDIPTYTCRRSIAAHSHWVKAVAISPDSRVIASGSFNGSIKLWSVETGECLKTLHGHRATVTSVTFRSSGAAIASGSYDETVKLWNVNTGQCVQTLHEHRNRVWSVAFSPDGQLLASGGDDHATRLWNLKTGHCAKAWKGHTNGILAIASSPQSSLLAVGHEDQAIRLWNLDRQQLVRSLQGHRDRVWSVAFAPELPVLASGSADRTIKLWNFQTGQCLATLTGHASWVWSVAFQPDGKRLASGSYDQTIKLWDVETRECLQTLEGHSAPIVSIRFRADGLLASSSFDTTIRIWDQGTCIQILKGHSNSVWAIDWSPNGILASSSYDHTLKLWDVETGECIHTFAGHLAPVVAIAFSPDGQYLASGSFDRTVKLWDLETRQCCRTFYGHAGLVSAVSFQPGAIDAHVDASAILMSGSFDETIRFWDIATGKALHTIRTPRPYEGMNVTGVVGVSDAQKATLRALGAIEPY